MSNSAKRKLAAGAVGLAVLAGGGGAYAAGNSGTAAKPADRAAEQKAFLDDVAKRLNVTRDQLDAAVKGAAEARIDAAVAAGTLTKEQGDAAKQGAGPAVRVTRAARVSGSVASAPTARPPISASARMRCTRSSRRASRSRTSRRRRTRTSRASRPR
jgi:hypothetical protein